MKYLNILISLFFLSSSFVQSQELFLFGTYEVTHFCDGQKVGDIYYYDFDGANEEDGYIEYNIDKKNEKYKAAYFGNYSFTNSTVKIELTSIPSPYDDGKAKLIRTVNGKPEIYTIERDYKIISKNSKKIVLGNNDECKNYTVQLKELSDEEYEEFMSKVN